MDNYLFNCIFPIITIDIVMFAVMIIGFPSPHSDVTFVMNSGGMIFAVVYPFLQKLPLCHETVIIWIVSAALSFFTSIVVGIVCGGREKDVPYDRNIEIQFQIVSEIFSLYGEETTVNMSLGVPCTSTPYILKLNMRLIAAPMTRLISNMAKGSLEIVRELESLYIKYYSDSLEKRSSPIQYFSLLKEIERFANLRKNFINEVRFSDDPKESEDVYEKFKEVSRCEFPSIRIKFGEMEKEMIRNEIENSQGQSEASLLRMIGLIVEMDYMREERISGE